MDNRVLSYLCWITLGRAWLLISVVIVGVSALRKAERIVKVIEHLSERGDQAFIAAAPVGKAAVDKGAEAIQAMDAKRLGGKAAEGVKELGGVAKEKALKWLNTAKEPANP